VSSMIGCLHLNRQRINSLVLIGDKHFSVVFCVSDSDAQDTDKVVYYFCKVKELYY